MWCLNGLISIRLYILMLDSISVIFSFLSTVLFGTYCLLSSEILEKLSIWSYLPLLTLSPLLSSLLSLHSPLPSSIFIPFLLFSLVKLYNKYLLKTFFYSFFSSECCIFSEKHLETDISGKVSFSFSVTVLEQNIIHRLKSYAMRYVSCIFETDYVSLVH